VAAAIDHNGGLLGIESFGVDEVGFESLLGWLTGFGSVVRIGVEGTGSWGVGLTRFLADQDVMVVEVDRPNRQKRRKVGKSDPTDAVSVARAALSGEASVTPKARNGAVEEIRVLMVARRSAREQRIQSLNQLRHLVFTAPEPIRVRFKDQYKTGLVTEAANMRPLNGSDPVVFTTNLMIVEPGETGETAQHRDGRDRPNARFPNRADHSVAARALRGRNRPCSHTSGRCRGRPRPAPLRTVVGSSLWDHPTPRQTYKHHPHVI
jgi:hypothetical protein